MWNLKTSFSSIALTPAYVIKQNLPQKEQEPYFQLIEVYYINKAEG